MHVKVECVVLMMLLLFSSMYFAGLVSTSPGEKDTVYVTWSIFLTKSYENIEVNGSGFVLKPPEIDGYASSSTSVDIEFKLPVKNIDNLKINGIIFYAYETGDKTRLAIQNSPGNTTIVLYANGVSSISIDKMEVRYQYKRMAKTGNSRTANIRTISFNIPDLSSTFNVFKNKGYKYSASVFLSWWGSGQLLSLKDPSNKDILKQEGSRLAGKVHWGWNSFAFSFQKLLEDGIGSPGTWKIEFEEIDPNTPSLFQFPIAVFYEMSADFYETVKLNPGQEYVLDLWGKIPKDFSDGWFPAGVCNVIVQMFSGSFNDLLINGALWHFESIGGGSMGILGYVYPFLTHITFKNTGSSSMEIGVKGFIPMYYKVPTQVSYKDNKITGKFDVKSPNQLPLYSKYKDIGISLGICIFHPGIWFQKAILSPQGKLVQEYRQVKGSWIDTYLPIYAGNKAFFHLMSRNKPFEGTWSYEAYIPMMRIYDPQHLVKFNPNPMYGPVYEDGYAYVYYNLGDVVTIEFTGSFKEENGVKKDFTKWDGNYYKGSEKKFKVKYDKPYLVDQKYVIGKKYFLEVKSKIGFVEGQGWYEENSKATVRVTKTEVEEKNVKYVFDHWSGDASGKSSSIEIVMNGPKKVEANWKKQYYLKTDVKIEPISKSISPSGIIEGEGWYDDGSKALIKILKKEIKVDDKEYVFDRWSEDVSGSNLNIEIVMDGPKNVVAVFKEKKEEKKCIIATTTYGSELSDEVQVLRNFRDNIVLLTYGGQSFYKFFNLIYYAWSPSVAKVIYENPWLKNPFKIILYPLISSLLIATSLVKPLILLNSEIAVYIAGIIVSRMLGLIYLGPIIYLIEKLRKKYK